MFDKKKKLKREETETPIIKLTHNTTNEESEFTYNKTEDYAREDRCQP